MRLPHNPGPHWFAFCPHRPDLSFLKLDINQIIPSSCLWFSIMLKYIHSVSWADNVCTVDWCCFVWMCHGFLACSPMDGYWVVSRSVFFLPLWVRPLWILMNYFYVTLHFPKESSGSGIAASKSRCWFLLIWRYQTAFKVPKHHLGSHQQGMGLQLFEHSITCIISLQPFCGVMCQSFLWQMKSIEGLA